MTLLLLATPKTGCRNPYGEGFEDEIIQRKHKISAHQLIGLSELEIDLVSFDICGVSMSRRTVNWRDF